MGNCVIARQFNDAVIARQAPIDGQRKGFEGRLRPQPRKDMRRRQSFVVAPLRPHVIENRAIGNVDFHHLVEARRSRAIFQDGQVGPFIQLDRVVQDRVRRLNAVVINKADGARRAPGHVDQNTIGRKGSVECCQGPQNRRLPCLLQHAVNTLRPVNIGLCFRQPLDGHMLHRQFIGGLCIEYSIVKDDPQRVGVTKDRRFVMFQHEGMCVVLGQQIRTGEFPILIASLRQTSGAQTCQGIGARGL